ncbi:MAG: biotin transporter BioY [Clostridia bacterium]|nr:biotin transporter BioY [Clostridia bacterium]
MEKKDRGRYAFTARKLCYTAVAVVVICLCAWISVPVGEIPVTLQTFGVCLAAGLLGWKYGLLAVLAYLGLGFVGVPVFAGFTGGVAKLLTPTGGYMLGFVCTAPLVGALTEKRRDKIGFSIVCMALGVAVCYAFGTLWFALFVSDTAVGLWAALLTCVFPFLPFDLIKIVLAAFLVKRLSPLIRK